MGMTICPDCKKEISDQAPACPNCGRKIDLPIKGIKDPFCKICRKKGKEVLMKEITVKMVPGGASTLATIMLVFGILGLLLYGAGLLLIIPAILIFSLAKKDTPMLECPECKGRRSFS